MGSSTWIQNNIKKFGCQSFIQLHESKIPGAMNTDQHSCLKLKNTFLELGILEQHVLHRATSCPATVSLDSDSGWFSHYLNTIDESEGRTQSAESAYTKSSRILQSINYTTVMLRNIPNKYSQSVLLDAVDMKGFKGQYDFFYLPVDFRNGCNMGYAFINFVWHDFAETFISAFRGFRLPALKSTKICDVSWARIQGLSDNIEHYRNNPINNLDPFFRPLVFEAGLPIDFPRPDKVLNRSSNRRSPISRCDQKPVASQADKIFVGGISPDTESADLRNYFFKFGEIIDCAIVRDKKSGLSRGFGFCCFGDSLAISNVLSVRQHIILGQSVGVRRYAIKS